jgi:hypothetical protein
MKVLRFSHREMRPDKNGVEHGNGLKKPMATTRGRKTDNGGKQAGFAVGVELQEGFRAAASMVLFEGTVRVTTLLSSSMAEHPAVNRRVVGSSPT